MSSAVEFLSGVVLNEKRFMSLLEKLIGESEFLQNSPPQGLIPCEDKASNHVLDVLSPFMVQNGGVLIVERVTFVEGLKQAQCDSLAFPSHLANLRGCRTIIFVLFVGRGNVIIKYPGTTDEVCSFVGSHLDVVPAEPKSWERNPFKLHVEGDMLYGRGTTDCLGHVALLTDLMATLAEHKPVLKTSIVVVFIVNEENSSFVGLGVDQLAKENYLDGLKRGPMFWIDAADSQPCIGTCGNLQWRMKVSGKLFHSGLPHRGINSIEMAMDAVSYVQKKFFDDFERHPKEDEYNFITQSTLKPTQISCAPGSLNQLPPDCTVEGDIRLSPFYDVADVRRAVNGYIDEMNSDPTILETPCIRGPHSKYALPDENKLGKIEFTWLFEGENGIACNLNSVGYSAIVEATRHVLGDVKPYSIGGSLPLIRQLQEQGFDVQISGYGISAKYHADNESASLESLKQATKIISKVISIMEAGAK